jgi:hypothetical protein
MALPTLPGDEKQDDKLNPGQQDYDRRFNDMSRAEEQGTFNDIANNYNQTADSSKEDANIKKLQERESEGDNTASGDFKSNYTGAKSKKSKVKAKVWFKRAGPLLGVGGTVGLLGLAITVLTTPSLLIVQMKEMMAGKFNTQLSSMDVRSNKLLLSKINGATKGLCTSKVSVMCRFSSMNDKQVQGLKDAGFTFNDEKKNILGRTTFSSLELDGKTIDARNYNSIIKSDSVVRSKFKIGYNPEYAGVDGKAWAAVAKKFKISKQAPDLGGENPDKAKVKLQDIAKEGMVDDSSSGSVIKEGDNKDPNCTSNCQKYTQADVDAANGAASTLATEGKSGSAGSTVKAAIGDLSAKIAAGSAGSAVKITGIADSTCTAIGALNTLTYAAKAIRTLQLVRYMMVFSSVADSIKAGGNPKPEDVAFLGTILTTTIASKTDPTKKSIGSATDSFGYKYAAYGDSSASKNSMNIANRFMAGGGMVGDLSNFSNTVYGFFSPGNRAGARSAAHQTCGVLANPVVQGVSILVGIGALFIPGVNVGVELAKAAFIGAMGIGISMIPSLVADIVAGTVTDGIVGEESGDAIASGAGSLLSDSLAGQNGAAPMTKADTLAYNNLQTSTNDQYIADELQTTSPLDGTNPHTFIGSIVASLLPVSSGSNPLNGLASLLGSSLKSIIPTSKAASNEDYAKSLDVCQDPDAIDGKFAVDPFCNVIRGIPPQYLNRDPIDIANALYASGDIDENGTPQTAYADFISKCMTSSDPLGYSGTGFDPEQAKACVINDSNANYYLNYMDQRIDLGMSKEDTGEATSTAATLTDKKALAQKIVAKNKVSYMDNSQPTLDKIANGSSDPNTMPCGINLNILQIIDKITDTHSITISDINRLCNGTVYASGNGSRHNAGNGSAIDIAVIDGKATNGRDANAISIINLVMPILSQAATSSGSYSQVGQVECGNTPPLAAGVTAFNDSCTHLHLDVPPKSDANLKYDPSGW